VPGRHNVYNALAAIAVGMEFNMEPQEMENGLNDYTQQNMRMSMLNIGNDIIVINDTYNASPQSMEAAISVLGEMKCKGRRIAVLGDMLELGDWSEKAHREVGRLLYVNNIDYVITMGENACAIGEGAIQSGMSAANVKMLDKIEEINSLLISLVKNGDIILVKGSRGMKMERVVDFLRNL
jgi:UDP-N-acetylmuramoyl-tripeptide--D-alanyl-D-alanine ligase